MTRFYCNSTHTHKIVHLMAHTVFMRYNHPHWRQSSWSRDGESGIGRNSNLKGIGEKEGRKIDVMNGHFNKHAINNQSLALSFHTLTEWTDMGLSISFATSMSLSTHCLFVSVWLAFLPIRPYILRLSAHLIRFNITMPASFICHFIVRTIP